MARFFSESTFDIFIHVYFVVNEAVLDFLKKDGKRAYRIYRFIGYIGYMRYCCHYYCYFH